MVIVMSTVGTRRRDVHGYNGINEEREKDRLVKEATLEQVI